MADVKTIWEELKDVPEDKLENLQSYIHSLRNDSKANDERRKKILSFAGMFNDLSESSFNEYKQQTENTRKHLFNRETE